VTPDAPRPASPRSASSGSPRATSSGSPRAASSGSPRAASSGSPRAASSGAADTRRLFVALELPPAARSALVAFRDAAADPDVWRPVPNESLHLTLAFLGRRPADDVAAVEDALRAAAGPAPRLALAGAVLLPPRRARVLCAALDDPDGTLAELQARVSDGLAAAGVYTPEKRPFRAHATVARLRPRARAPRTVSGDPEPLEFHGEALTLFESRLHPHGARYEPLVRLNLH
jgi:2'-5' RNA ligase